MVLRRGFRVKTKDIPTIIFLYKERDFSVEELANQYRLAPITVKRILQRNKVECPDYKYQNGVRRMSAGVVRDSRGMIQYQC